MEINLFQPLAPDSQAHAPDVRAAKILLNHLGYYRPYDKVGITGIADSTMFDAFKKFQGDFGLPVTGVAKPGDATIKRLNAQAAKKPTGKYIWRTVGDENVRSSHADLNGTIRDWNDTPIPGQEVNCRCWAELINNYPDAISPTISPLDILAGGAVVKGGARIGVSILSIIKNILQHGPRLNASQTENFARFLKKIPANSRNSVKISKLPNGHTKFTATSPGKVRGSKAIYEKIVDSQGRTVGYTKTTYDQFGNRVHIKDKIGGGK